LAKNTGKTVTVNYLIAGATQVGLSLGLTSTGRDGETMDILSSLSKPEIRMPEGAVLATSRGSASQGSARLEILGTTGISNTLGEIVIARIREAGTVEISGPERTEDLRVITSRLQELADLVIVDGALDRLAASAPSVTEAVVLATGAVVGADVKAVVLRTVHAAQILKLPVAENLNPRAVELIKQGKLGVYRGDSVEALDLPTAIDAPLEILDYLGPPATSLLLGGALTDELAELLISASRNVAGLEAVVRDGTRVFIGPARWQRLQRAGVKVKSVEPINLVAITVNPVDPRGRQLPGRQLIGTLKQLLPGLLVINPLREGD
jgi:hypothetical protein